MVEKQEQGSGAQRGCCKYGGDKPDGTCWLIPSASSSPSSRLPSRALSPAPAWLQIWIGVFLHVVMTGQTTVLSRGASWFPSVSPSTSCSLIFTQNCFLKDIFFRKQLLLKLTELGWSSFKEMRSLKRGGVSQMTKGVHTVKFLDRASFFVSEEQRY